MKNIIPILGLCLALCGCGEDAPPSKPGSSYTPPNYKKNEPAVTVPAQPAQPAQSAQPTPAASPAQSAPVTSAQPATVSTPAASAGNTGRPSTQILNDAAAVVDYGTGATPLNVKRKQADKIQAIQNQYNQKTNKSINDK